MHAYEQFVISRIDGSKIEAYLTMPQDETKVPIIFLFQGSDPESVITNHEILAKRFVEHGIGLLSIEKRGINSHSFDNQLFIEHDCYECRLQDIAEVLNKLKEGLVPLWNGKVIVLGGSEGGKVAPKIALQYPHQIVGVILIGAGGGIPFGAEMKYQIEIVIENQNPFKKIYSKIRNILLPKEIDSHYAMILEHPDSLEIWCYKSYKWWASYLKYDPLPDLIQINSPLYMVHGVLDLNIPVESADRLKTAFDFASKRNLTYARYADLGHTLKGREDVYRPLIEWVKEVFLLKVKMNDSNTGCCEGLYGR